MQRFKGWGNEPRQLRETTSIRIPGVWVQLTISEENYQETMSVMDMLLGKKRAEDRRNWLQEKGDQVELDV